MQKPGRVKKGLIDHKVSLDVKSDPGWPLIYPKLPDLISMLAASPDWEFASRASALSYTLCHVPFISSEGRKLK